MNCVNEASKKNGKVWLVGAGPSDMELLTIKGKRLLELADIIVYDRLVGQGILSYGSKSATYIDVGKKAGHHPILQEEINQILAKEAKKGKRVVRLKGGDPFVFGRGAEEIEVLVKEHIPYEVVPGVTSATAVAAYLGIPVTHRGVASSFHVITAHKQKDRQLDIPYGALKEVGGTLIFLMGVTTLSQVCQGLLEAGMCEHTKAAILERGTTAKQRKIMGTLGTLPTLAKAQQVKSPSIIIVGEVCELTGLDWYQNRPLAGKKVLVTRPKEQMSRIADMLREQGAEVLEAPSIRIVPIINNKRLMEAVTHIEQYNWLVLTSPSGAELFFKALKEQRMDVRKLAHLKIAVIGAGTKKVVEAFGMYPELMPSQYDGAHLGSALGERATENEKILIARAKIGNPELVELIQKRCQAQIDDIPLYDTVYDGASYIDYNREFEEEETDYAMFTSASTVKGFVANTRGLDYSKVKALCIGKQTKEEAMRHGMRTYMAKEPTLEALLQLTEDISK